MIYLSKAYDRIRWDFVEAILRKMKFPKFWIQWILQCIITVSYSILVNGEPTNFFKPLVGLTLGDPLSSYIFFLCMKTFSNNLSKLQAQKELEGLKMAISAPTLTHLFFTDDALLFFKALPKNYWAMKNLHQIHKNHLETPKSV